jgi:hypothetical protein
MKRNGTTLQRQYPLLAAIITQGHQASAGCPFLDFPDERQAKFEHPHGELLTRLLHHAPISPLIFPPSVSVCTV